MAKEIDTVQTVQKRIFFLGVHKKICKLKAENDEAKSSVALRFTRHA